MIRPVSFRSFPKAIVHIDGDAFFASCEQARNPKLRGKPVVTGKERGIAASMSYEAKALGVTRGMPLFQIRRLIPECIILPSDYETYSLYSVRMFEIVRRYTPEVEEYSIDECFADLTGLRRYLHKSYSAIARAIKHDLDTELGFTFSVGLAPTKVLAKIASKWQKPSGLTVIPGSHAHFYLDALPVEKVWGIGPQTAELLAKLGVKTALEFAYKPEAWVNRHFSKPYREIWHELRGTSVKPVSTETQAPQSIIKSKTFTPPSRERSVVFAQLSKNIENACIKARRHGVAAKRIVIYLKDQDYRSSGLELELRFAAAIPSELVRLADAHFGELFEPNRMYRSTGVMLVDLETRGHQPDLFGESLQIEKLTRLYKQVDALQRKFGKHTVFLGSSFLAMKRDQHAGERGNLPERKLTLLPGETARKRLAIPYLGEVR